MRVHFCFEEASENSLAARAPEALGTASQFVDVQEYQVNCWLVFRKVSFREHEFFPLYLIRYVAVTSRSVDLRVKEQEICLL